MEMKFSYPASQDNMLCEQKYFVSNIRYQLQCRNGWATILDPIDDITMCHEVGFENDDDNDIEGYRLTWIVRWVNSKQDYFVDTSGMRRTARMMEVYGMTSGLMMHTLIGCVIFYLNLNVRKSKVASSIM
jgi:hypothetical protein